MTAPPLPPQSGPLPRRCHASDRRVRLPGRKRETRVAEIVHRLPYAPDRDGWGYVERSELGVHGACDLVLGLPLADGDGPELPERLRRAFPLLLHEWPLVPLEGLPLDGPAPEAASGGAAGQLAAVDAADDELGGDLAAAAAAAAVALSPAELADRIATLGRILPRLLTFHYREHERRRDFVFAGDRPASLHVLARVTGTAFRFRLEDLSHFATHGELLVSVLDAIGLPRALDPEHVLYCPAIDPPYPFKFFVVGEGRPNREVYLEQLRLLIRRTESDEAFRARHFRELSRGFEKFGPASATPGFQKVELRLWRLLSYLAARLRVKAGRLTDARDPAQVRQFLAELRHVHAALDDLVHLPGRLAAFFRSRFDLELSELDDHALRELDQLAARVDCQLSDPQSIDEVAELVSQFRRLGSVSSLESLEQNDIEILGAYGDVPVPALETGWARRYSSVIFTGAERFDTRRYKAPAGEVGAGSEPAEEVEEESLDLDLSF